MAFGIVRQFFNNSRNQARRELRGCFLKGGSDILDRATPAISLEGADQLLDAGLPGGFLADQRVAQIEEQPTIIRHRSHISTLSAEQH